MTYYEKTNRYRCYVCDNRNKRERRTINKRKAVDYKGGQCIICGYKKSIYALEFHHINPKMKDYQISENRDGDFSKLIPELDKCILVCSNCHKEIHNNDLNISKYIENNNNNNNKNILNENISIR